MKCDCGSEAEWRIGTARIPVCSAHHKKWLECFSYKMLQEYSLAIERVVGERSQ